MGFKYTPWDDYDYADSNIKRWHLVIVPDGTCLQAPFSPYFLIETKMEEAK